MIVAFVAEDVDALGEWLLATGAAQPTKFITLGSVLVSAVGAWVGIDPPACSPDASVNLRAPDGPHDNPLAWGYTHVPDKGRPYWSWEPDGAVSCFAHTDLGFVLIPD